MFHITDKMISDYCTNYSTYLKARNYYLSGRVKTLKYDREYNIFTAIVQGKRNYGVEVELDMTNEISDATCTCPAYHSYSGHCKHIGAVLLEIVKRDRERPKKENTNTAEKILDFFSNRINQSKKLLNLEITYEFYSSGSMKGINSSSLSFTIGEEKLYKVKSIKNLMEAIENKKELYFGKKFTFNPYIHIFKDEDMPIINLVSELYENEMYMNESSYGYNKNTFFQRNKINLTDGTTKRFFNIVENQSIKAVIRGQEYSNVEIVEERLPLDFILTKEKDDLLLKFDLQDNYTPLVRDGEYFFIKGKIHKVPREQREYIRPFYDALTTQGVNDIKIPREHSESFVSDIYPYIKEIGEVKIDKKLESSIYKPEIKPEIYLDKNMDGITADVKLIYGDILIRPFSKEGQNSPRNGRILIRDRERENKILDLFEDADFRVKNDVIHLDEEKSIFDFMYTGLLKLQDIADIYYSDAFKAMKIKDVPSFLGGVKLSSEENMLEFDFRIDGIDKSELKDLFDSFKERKKYYKLKDGSFLPLNIPELEEISGLIDYLDISSNDLSKEIIEIPKFRALYLDDHIKESDIHYIKRELKFKELVQNIKEPGDIDYSIPESLESTLREYQKLGFKWLKTLSVYGFGGILADDMGLGKTIQILAFLLSEKNEKGTKPSLVVAPTSLVYNWAAEVEKFTPELKFLIIAGNKDEREENVERIEDYDLVITSYPLIRRDSELYEKSSFRYCILDEAQHIKNPNSVGAKSVKTIKSENYFALTGTPIENSLTELWSIFDFIMPGYLLSHNKFKKRFENPIIKNQEKKELQELKRHINPFILRRLKKTVLTELPDKIESRMIAELSREQKKVYLAYLEQIKGEIDAEIKSKGFNRSHIKILAGLTRLRQICCDPAMFLEDFKGDSGKLLLLEEIIDDALDSNHRILLFSQFTSMLAIIKTMLDKKEIDYKYLDGSTPSEKRGVLVKEFNEGEGDIFLISLKAGGTGLNLTGADMVIHYDPWWNPAVEDQATDRAHRIGQKNSVQVIKLITQGTIEEKIYELQERKRKMIESVIEPGETLVSKLTEDEIKSLFQI